MVDSIEANVESASIRVNEGTDELRMAERYQVRLSVVLRSIIFFLTVYNALYYSSSFDILLSFSHPNDFANFKMWQMC